MWVGSVFAFMPISVSPFESQAQTDQLPQMIRRTLNCANGLDALVDLEHRHFDWPVHSNQASYRQRSETDWSRAFGRWRQHEGNGARDCWSILDWVFGTELVARWMTNRSLNRVGEEGLRWAVTLLWCLGWLWLDTPIGHASDWDSRLADTETGPTDDNPHVYDHAMSVGFWLFFFKKKKKIKYGVFPGV